MSRPNQLTNAVLAQLLDQHGLGPAGDPVGWDYRQRAFDDHWAAGGSARSFVDHVLSEERAIQRCIEARSLPDTGRPLHWTEAMAILRRKYRADY